MCPECEVVIYHIIVCVPVWQQFKRKSFRAPPPREQWRTPLFQHRRTTCMLYFLCLLWVNHLTGPQAYLHSLVQPCWLCQEPTGISPESMHGTRESPILVCLVVTRGPSKLLNKGDQGHACPTILLWFSHHLLRHLPALRSSGRLGPQIRHDRTSRLLSSRVHRDQNIALHSKIELSLIWICSFAFWIPPMKHPGYRPHSNTSEPSVTFLGEGIEIHMSHMIHTRVVCFHYLKLNRLIYIYETHLFLENLAQEDFNNPSG